MSENYDLQKSKKSVHELYPVIKDAHGNVIDGFHRLEADPNWKTETLPMIDTPVKLALARIVANTHRRDISKEERKLQLVTLAEELIREGKPKDKIISILVDLTTFTDSYLYRMLPDEYKQRPGVGSHKEKGDLMSPLDHPHVYDEGSTKCRICDRELSAPESVAAGIGPVCAKGGAPAETATGAPSSPLVQATAPAQQQTTPTREERGHAVLDELYAKFGDPTHGFKRSILMMRLPCYSDEADRIVKSYKPKPTEPKAEERKPEPAPSEGNDPSIEVVIEIRVDGKCIQGYPVKLTPGQKLEILVDGDTVHTETAPEEAVLYHFGEDRLESAEEAGLEEEIDGVDDVEGEEEEHDTEEEHPHQPTGPEEAP